MPNSRNEAPVIPDHEVLRKIGSGAYGEVWLARAVTGALRAVKVVFREDFDDKRGFEREFDGVLKYEPVSRTHPGLVHVLHVGRSTDGESFYYYVMELGDDQYTGAEINPVEYEARTLRSDFKKAEGKRLDTELCIEVGACLADALEHLHKHGLAHRDVKPANVIFVGGKAKLADIGLVAVKDQRTFVGTEGFVPPEGPGSAQADVYSLGKVLYEIATGKDRLDFPDMPDDLPSGPELKRWHELNRIICETCEPRLSHRAITSAGQLSEALHALMQGKRHRRRHRQLAGVMTGAVLLMFTGAVAWHWVGKPWWEQRQKRVDPVADIVTPPPPTEGLVKIVSYPQDADVLDAGGNLLGTTPLTLTAKIGERMNVSVRKPGFRPREYSEVVPASASSEPFHIGLTPLENFTPPVKGQPWDDPLGAAYRPDNERHMSINYVTEQAWRRFAETNKRPLSEVEFLPNQPQAGGGAPLSIVLATPVAMEGYCDWLRNAGIQGGYLTEDMEAVPVIDDAFAPPGLSERAKTEGLRPFHVMVHRIAFATLELTTTPPGADVFLNDQAVGNTQQPLVLNKIKPGPVEIIVVIEGYKPAKLNLTAGPNDHLIKNIELQQNQGVVFGKPWQNGVGMKFVPIATDLMAAAWETRVKDYELFAKETKRRAAPTPDFPQTPDHPVVNVTRDDAIQFCKWLTERERKAERIAAAHVYRLPTDLEWSRMAGLNEEEGEDLTPSHRDARKAALFPWGTSWPLPQGEKPGNLADESALSKAALSRARIISGYNDGFAHTAPVGSFSPSPAGLYDMCGNVYEWVSDNYSSRSPLGVLRGGGWNTYQQENLYLGSRNVVPEKYRDNMYGFRVVLTKLPPKQESHPEPK